ncbi:PD-(D/E)XK nuclease family protein [Kribbella sp. NBC_01484]|uniref:PD-(D/E)XK nuclease family protein n=1 Tax=Kribbella sp. NBC_01484 TaxID=2903579 RepID=UPI002E3000C7|nr:PD-(D/E)XK nuclease family protein [Kribbella sp. NBC_01484]
MSSTRIESTAYGAAALECLEAVVARLKADDPMTPVTLLLPNNLAGVIARRHLARSGIAGLYLATLERLAEQLAAGVLSPRRPATRPIVAATWRTALSKAPGIFEDVAEHPSTIQALASAHRELRDLTDPALEKVTHASTLGPDLVRLHRHVTTELAADWYDETDLLRAAATRIATSPAVAGELGALVLFLPQELTQSEAAFVEALGSAAADLTVIVGLTDVRRADRAVRRSLERIGIDLPSSISKNYPVATEILNASDADDEVRCVVRDVVEALDHTPAHRIAVLYSAASPYARLLHEHLGAARIEVNGPGTRPVHERAIARTLLEVLALIDQDLPRADVFRALANAPTRDFTSQRIPVPQWERMSRAAGVVRGDDWDTRLARYAESERRTADQEEAAEDPRPAAVRRAQYNASMAERLHAFASELRRRLGALALLETWSELAGGVLRLFHDLLGDYSSLPIEEQYAAAAVESSLKGLSTLDELGTPAGLAVLRDVLDLELQQSLPRVGTFGTGVLVAPLSASIGLAADIVYVVGLSEDLYPGRVHEDALLPHRVREAAAPELASFRDRLDEKQRHLLVAFSAGSRKVVASFPRGDLRRSSRRLPTRWLLGSLRELTGDHGLPATQWDRYGERLRTSASYAGSLTTATMPATEQEWQVRAAAARLWVNDEVLVRARELLRGRGSNAFTRFDGDLSGVPGLPEYAVEERIASPTSLEAYATCPHAYFVERLLQVEPLEAPEDLLVISPLQVGNLIHNSLDAFVSRLAGSLPGYGEPWTAEQRSLLLAIGADLADQFEAEGLTGHPRLWQRERLRILGDLMVLLTDDDRWRVERDASVVASELRFGFDGEPPVEIPVPSGRVLLRGSADKVDLGADGTIYVTDVKTGGFSRYEAIESDPVAGGTKLQLPVYAYAARARLGEQSTPVEASYWFVRRGGKRIPVPLTPEVEARYVDTLDVIVSSIAAGFFPPKAPEVPDFLWVQCPYCNPDGLGHSEVRARWDRKRHDPTLERLVRLIDPTALELLASEGAGDD